MVKHGCANGGTLDGSNYSSPMPVIGLYIAGCTLVCFLFILFDVFGGWRQTKHWLPCNKYSLNALTLTLLAVVAKLPVDLTSEMPSAEDQLSKLTATTLICVSLAFFLPSLGSMGRLECSSNLVALTIFVITLIVNICIQIGTGVIFTFIVEHIIVLFSMLLLLVLLWCSSLEISSEKDYSSEGIKHILIKCQSGISLKQRLKLCYLHSYMSDPQLIICMTPYIATVGILSTVCTLLLSEAVFRSLFFKQVNFCGGNSDYQWSMWIVFGSQIVVVILGCSGNLIRLATLIDQVNPGPSYFIKSLRESMRGKANWMRYHSKYITIFMLVGVSSLNKWVALLSKRVVLVFRRVMKYLGVSLNEKLPIGDIKQYIAQLQEHFIFPDGWILMKAVEKMDTWMHKMEITNSHSHLNELLSKFPPSDEPFSHYFRRINANTRQKADWIPYMIPDDYRPSCLSLVILVKQGADTLPEELVNSFESSLAEVFELICFIDEKTNVFSFRNKEKLESAKEISEVGLKQSSHNSSLRAEMSIMEKFINNGVLSSDPRDVQNYMQQLFVDMLSYLLVNLPGAIIKNVVEGPSEGYNDRIKFSSECIHRVRLIENKIKWEFPSVTDITHLITPQASSSRSSEIQGMFPGLADISRFIFAQNSLPSSSEEDSLSQGGEEVSGSDENQTNVPDAGGIDHAVLHEIQEVGK